MCRFCIAGINCGGANEFRQWHLLKQPRGPQGDKLVIYDQFAY